MDDHELEQSYLEWKSGSDPGVTREFWQRGLSTVPQMSHEVQQTAESANYDDSCPFCGSGRLVERSCKVWCGDCHQLVRTCSDL